MPRYPLPRPALRRLAAACWLAVALVHAAPAQTTDFARLVDRLSEAGGFFDSDNLVSNETAYLHVMGGLRALGVHGGAYLGVGPEQSFSYIAEIEPELAILIDIRRDNMLLHLLLKAMFEASRNRMEYLCRMFGRPAPRDLEDWADRDLAALVDYLDRTPLDPARHARTHRSLMRRVERFGVPLTAQDRATIRRFHDDFAAAGLGLTFTTLGRPPRRNYPTLRRLYLETDLDGNRASYLATEQRWRRIKALHRAGRIVPVVGDLAGPRAMRAIAEYLSESRLTVSALYVSNVEMYLFRYGTFPAYVANVRALPAGPSSALIRSWFNRAGWDPGAGGDHFSTQLLQTFARFLALTAQPERTSYWSLVSDSLVPR